MKSLTFDPNSTQNPIFSLNHVEEDELIEKPDEKKAIQFLNNVSVRKYDPIKMEFSKYSLWENIYNFGAHYGQGIFFYFFLLKYLIVSLLILSFPAGAMMAINFIGFGLTDNQSQLYIEKFSLGNTNNYGLALSKLIQSTKSTSSKSNDLDDLILTLKWKSWTIVSLDCLAIFILIIMFAVYICLSNRYQKKILHEKLTIQDYAVEITNLPKEATKDEIRSIFERFGTIKEIDFSWEFKGMLTQMKKVSSIICKQKLEKARLIMQRLDKVDVLDEIEKKSKKHLQNLKKSIEKNFDLTFNSIEDLQPLSAFIIFDKISVKNNVLNTFSRFNKKGFLWYLSCGRDSFLKKVPDEHKFQNKVIPKLRIPDNPLDIYWENIEITWGEQTFKHCLLLLLIFLIFLLGLIAVFFINLTGSIILPNDCPYNLSFDDFDKKGDYLNDEHALLCFCHQNKFIDIINSTKLLNLCNSYYIQILLIPIINVIIALVVVFMNFIIQVTIKALANLFGYYSYSHKEKKTIKTMFWATFLNTLLLPILSNLAFYQFDLSHEVAQLLNISSTNTTFHDFSREWYSHIGTQFVVFLCFKTIQPIFTIFYFFIKKFIIQIRLSTTVLQKDYNDLIEPSEFDLASRYAHILNIFFISTVFGGGLPILIPISLVNYFLNFWVNKIIFVNWAKKPHSFDNCLNQTVITLIPLALALRIIISDFMMISPEIFPEQSNISISNLEVSYENYVKTLTIQAFYTNQVSHLKKFIIYPILLICLFFVYIAKNLFYKIISDCYSLVKGVKISPENTFKIDLHKSYTHNLEILKQDSIVNYDIRNNPLFKDTFLMIKNELNSITSSDQPVNEKDSRVQDFNTTNKSALSSKKKKIKNKVNFDPDSFSSGKRFNLNLEQSFDYSSNKFNTLKGNHSIDLTQSIDIDPANILTLQSLKQHKQKIEEQERTLDYMIRVQKAQEGSKIYQNSSRKQENPFVLPNSMNYEIDHNKYIGQTAQHYMNKYYMKKKF